VFRHQVFREALSNEQISYLKILLESIIGYDIFVCFITHNFIITLFLKIFLESYERKMYIN